MVLNIFYDMVKSFPAFQNLSLFFKCLLIPSLLVILQYISFIPYPILIAYTSLWCPHLLLSPKALSPHLWLWHEAGRIFLHRLDPECLRGRSLRCPSGSETEVGSPGLESRIRFLDCHYLHPMLRPRKTEKQWLMTNSPTKGSGTNFRQLQKKVI